MSETTLTKIKATSRPIDYIVIHCSATPPWSDIGAADIDRWHRERGWDSIGYHYVIRRDGSVESGRPESYVGAHARGFNGSSIGVCLAGGVDGQKNPQDNFTTAQMKALAQVIYELRGKYRSAEVLGHRDLPGVAKACPSFDVKQWMKS